jgi:hypothetical protein
LPFFSLEPCHVLLAFGQFSAIAEVSMGAMNAKTNNGASSS